MRAHGFRYSAYGLAIASDIPLPLPQYDAGVLGEIEYRSAKAPMRSAAAEGGLDETGDAWHQYAALPDGATYVRWKDVGEFLVSTDGQSITGWQAEASSGESFLVYMLGQALSFALVVQGFEPLHATAIVVDGSAIVFLGDSGFGKSSLAACCLNGGYRLLTDDLLLVHEDAGRMLAYPGPARIKLFPKVARRFVPAAGDCPPLNGGTAKSILPIDRAAGTAPTELRAIYVLAAPRDVCRRDSVSSEPLSAREAFIELVKSTFNRRLADPRRLQRQFESMTRIANRVPVRRLLYPRSLDRLPEVRDLVLSEVQSRRRSA
jgi:hypothetical protein